MNHARPSARLDGQAGPFDVRDAAFEPLEARLQLPVLDELREVFFGRRDIEDIEEISRIELAVILLSRGDGVWPDNREIEVLRVRLPRRARIAVVPPEAPQAGIEDQQNAARDFDLAEEDEHQVAPRWRKKKRSRRSSSNSSRFPAPRADFPRRFISTSRPAPRPSLRRSASSSGQSRPIGGGCCRRKSRPRPAPARCPC